MPRPRQRRSKTPTNALNSNSTHYIAEEKGHKERLVRLVSGTLFGEGGSLLGMLITPPLLLFLAQLHVRFEQIRGLYQYGIIYHHKIG